MNLEEDMKMLESESAIERALSDQLRCKQEEVEFLRHELKKTKEELELLKSGIHKIAERLCSGVLRIDETQSPS